MQIISYRLRRTSEAYQVSCYNINHERIHTFSGSLKDSFAFISKIESAVDYVKNNDKLYHLNAQNVLHVAFEVLT